MVNLHTVGRALTSGRDNAKSMLFLEEEKGTRKSQQYILTPVYLKTMFIVSLDIPYIFFPPEFGTCKNALFCKSQNTQILIALPIALTEVHRESSLTAH